MSIKHHLVDFLCVVIIVNSHYVEVIDGCLILEGRNDWLLSVLCHGSRCDLLSFPVSHQVGLLRCKHLEVSVSVDSDDLKDTRSESFRVLLLLPKLMHLDDARSCVSKRWEVESKDGASEVVDKDDRVITQEEQSLVHCNSIVEEVDATMNIILEGATRGQSLILIVAVLILIGLLIDCLVNAVDVANTLVLVLEGDTISEAWQYLANTKAGLNENCLTEVAHYLEGLVFSQNK